MKEKIIKWKAHEYEFKQKSPDWYWSIWIVSVVLIILSVINGSALLAILIFFSAFTLSVQAARKPEIINFKIDDLGITVDKARYTYGRIESYWIERDEDPQIILKMKKTHLFSQIVIPLENVDVKEVDNYLADYLKKEEMEVNFVYKLTKYL